MKQLKQQYVHLVISKKIFCGKFQEIYCNLSRNSRKFLTTIEVSNNSAMNYIFALVLHFYQDLVVFNFDRVHVLHN